MLVYNMTAIGTTERNKAEMKMRRKSEKLSREKWKERTEINADANVHNCPLVVIPRARKYVVVAGVALEGGTINIRRNMSMDSDVIGKLSTGTIIETTEEVVVQHNGRMVRRAKLASGLGWVSKNEPVLGTVLLQDLETALSRRFDDKESQTRLKEIQYRNRINDIISILLLPILDIASGHR
jgi:hypothetical protein